MFGKILLYFEAAVLSALQLFWLGETLLRWLPASVHLLP
jgi:hypothetical protein